MADANDPPEAEKGPSPLHDLGLGVATLLGLAAALAVLDRLMPPAALGTAMLGALAVDVAASRVGVRWDDDGTAESPPEDRRPAQRVLSGAAAALGAGAVVIAIGAAAGWIHKHGPAAPTTAIFFALLRASAVAVRDEVLYRGIPLFFAAKVAVPPHVARVFAALTGAAAMALVPGAQPAGIALSAGLGFLTASLWQRDRGAWAAIGAHAAWVLLFGSILHGGLFDADWVTGNIAIGNASRGAPAWAAAAVLVLAGLAVRWIPGLGPGPEKKSR